MSALTFDTHEFVKTLIDSRFEPRQAEAVSKAFKTASGEAELVTKRDVETLKRSEHKANTINRVFSVSIL